MYKYYRVITKEGNFVIIKDQGQLITEIPLLEVDRFEYSEILERTIPAQKKQRFFKMAHYINNSGNPEIFYTWEPENEG